MSSHEVVFDKKNYSALAYMSRLYLEALNMRPAVLYTPYATSSHEQTVGIITFAQFEEGNLVEKKCDTEEDESISASIDESYIYNDSDGGSISTDALKDIWYGSQIHPELNAIYDIFGNT